MPDWSITTPYGSITSTYRGGGGANSIGGPIAGSGMQQYKIIDLVTGTSFSFHAMPDSISRSKSASWQSIDIQSRSSPLQGYANSEPQTIRVMIPIFASIEQGDGRTPRDVKEACDFFLSLGYPDYQRGIKPPHKVKFIAGEQFSLVGIVPNIDIEYPGPWDPTTGLSHRARVTFTLLEVDDVPKDYMEVRNDGLGASQNSTMIERMDFEGEQEW